jgi:hypothetical protein
MSRGGHNRFNDSVNDYKTIDILAFQREGKLTEGGSGYYTSTWRSSRTGENLGSILVFTTPISIRFVYTTTDTKTGYKQNHDYCVLVEWTLCNYGGKRAWFVCSKCSKRVRKLYLKSGCFHCRNCQKLNYYSQQQSKGDQLMSGIREKIYYIQKQLKENRLDHNIAWIPRPKGMHKQRYYRFTEKMHELQCEHERAFISELNRRFRKK